MKKCRKCSSKVLPGFLVCKKHLETSLADQVGKNADPYIALYRTFSKEKWRVLKISKQEPECWYAIDQEMAKDFQNYPNNRPKGKVFVLGMELKRN